MPWVAATTFPPASVKPIQENSGWVDWRCSRCAPQRARSLTVRARRLELGQAAQLLHRARYIPASSRSRKPAGDMVQPRGDLELAADASVSA
jgi:hypothetical protein